VHLSPDEARLFYKLNAALLLYINQQVRVLPGIETTAAFVDAPFLDKVSIRDALYDHPELIDQFVSENPEGFTTTELAAVSDWNHFVRGSFYVLRYLKRYAVFLDSGSLARAFGVLGIVDSIEDIIPRAGLPVRVETVLRPFGGRIIYDGVLRASSIVFGAGMRRGFSEEYQAVRATQGVTERLGVGVQQSESDLRPRRTPKALPPLLPSAERIVQDAESLKGAQTAEQRRALAVLRAAAGLLRETAGEGDRDQIVKGIRRTRTALTQLEREIERQIWGY